MEITTEAVKELRDKTGISVMECKKALEAAGGDMAKALEFLSTRAAAVALKKADRELGAGTVASYVHSTGAVGALVLLSCETDFVSKNDEFVQLARDIAMHVAAMKPENEADTLEQDYIKDPSKKVRDLLAAATQKFGERTVLTRVVCFSVAQ